MIGLAGIIKLSESMLQETKPAASIPGGKAEGRSPSEFDPKQLRKGIKIEHEHTPSKRRAMEISMDHITEHKNYYDHLPAFENKLASYYMYKQAFPFQSQLMGLAKIKPIAGIRRAFEIPKPPPLKPFGSEAWHINTTRRDPTKAIAPEKFKLSFV